MRDLVGTIVRGVRSRALLSAGCVLLVALAVASAVLGPAFQVAASTSYLLTRVNSAPPQTTGLARTLDPGPNSGPQLRRADAEELATTFAADDTGPFGPVRFTYVTTRVTGGLVETDIDAPGESMLLAKDGACEHLTIDQGRCPAAPGEALVLRGDADHTATKVGARLDLGPDLPEQVVVGTYLVPAGEEEFWYDLDRLSSSPRRFQDPGVDRPYEPAPYVVVPETFDAIDQALWRLRFDRRIELPPDWTEADLDAATADFARASERVAVGAGASITGDPVGGLDAYVAEARAQEATSRASIAPAVLSLVLVALALLLRLLVAAAELRTPELALASLRGVRERRLWGLGLAEPLALLVAGIPLGLLAGYALTRTVMAWWLAPELPFPVPGLLYAAVAAVVLAAVAVSVAAVAGVLTGSLSSQLTGIRRPAAPRRVLMLAELVLLALAVAVLVSKLSVTEPGDPDLTDMVLPVVLAVVAGLATTRLIAGLARWRSRRPGRTLPGFVAARALGRRAEGTLVILPITAALAVGVFATGVDNAASGWRSSVAATSSPGHTLWKAPGTMAQAVTDSHEVDPAGEHALALGVLSVPGTRLSVVDAPRLANVLDWPETWTPGTSPAQVQDAIASAGAPIRFSGRRLSVRVAENTVRSARDLTLTVHLFTSDGQERDAYMGPIGRGQTGEGSGGESSAGGGSTVSEPVPYCRGGCTLAWMTLAGPATLQTALEGEIVLSGFLADGEPIAGALAPDAAWVQSAGLGGLADIGDVETLGQGQGQGHGQGEGQEQGLRLRVDSGGEDGMLRMVPGGVSPLRPVLVGVDSADRLEPLEGGGFGLPLSGATLPVQPEMVTQSMPFLGPDGVMIDYRQLISDRYIYDDTFLGYVATDADTPQRITDALLARGYVVQSTRAGEEKLLGQGAYALALRLYGIVAIMVLVMALAGLVVSTAVQLPARRRDVAALRVVGVPRRSVLSAVAREFLAVLAGAAVAGIAAGALAQYVVTRTVRLGYAESILTPALVARVDWGWIALLVAAAATAFGVFALAFALLTVRGARGATLRDSAR